MESNSTATTNSIDLTSTNTFTVDLANLKLSINLNSIPEDATSDVTVVASNNYAEYNVTTQAFRFYDCASDTITIEQNMPSDWSYRLKKNADGTGSKVMTWGEYVPSLS